jgi:thiol:disulfide interchange protein
MTGKFGFFAFLLAVCVAVFFGHRPSGRAPVLSDKAMIVRQAEYRAALDESRRTGQPLVLDFYADWCGPCRWMHDNTWSDPRVARAMSNFVFMPVNVDTNSELSGLYGVSGIPHVVIVSPDGRILRSQTGAVPPDALLAWLPEVTPQRPAAR